MPSGRPPGSNVNGVRFRDLLLLSFFASIAAAALQKPPQYASGTGRSTDDIVDAASAVEQGWRVGAADSLHTPHAGQRGYRDTDVKVDNTNNERNARNSRSNERALATVSPAESNPAVRAPPAQWASATSGAGLTSRHLARSLQDWQVEDIMLLATVDGNLHACDRRTGIPRWTLETDREMIETVRHRNNKTVDEDGIEQEDPLFIVEPTQDGSIYILAPGFGLQRLGYTVKQLADLSPYAGEGYPAVAYTAEKKNTLYTVDAATGNILKSFSSAGSMVNEDQSCRRVDPLGALEGDECQAVGTLTLGRTEYIIGIQDRNTGEPINTVKYFEWGPNNRDHDLRSKYTRTMDQRYVYPKHDGQVLGVDLTKGTKYKPVPERPSFVQKFPSPVARIFDIVRPNGDHSRDASLVILPQPIGPAPNELTELEAEDGVFLNRTETGSWYALSEEKYPSVTDRAPDADFCNADCFNNGMFTGVHYLSPQNGHSGLRQIDGNSVLTIDSPPVDEAGKDIQAKYGQPTPFRQDHQLTLWTLVLMLLAGLSGCGFVYKQHGIEAFKFNRDLRTASVLQPAVNKINAEEPTHTPTKIREDEPAQETIFPHEETAAPPSEALKVRFEDPVKEGIPETVPEEDVLEKVDSEEASPAPEGDETKEDAGPKTPKKKATRGKRAGRKQKEKEQALVEARAKKHGTEVAVPAAAPVAAPAQVISVAASESPQVSGPLQINSLVINTDKVIGQGSCGTIVFEGSFEGRDVAVKRMLSQYYELASQEVSFLQQSDDHPNVVRYFCQQKDDHFLYIAVELCQASLFEVWEADKAKTEERHVQMRTLKLAIQQDMTRTLQQLAAGLCHLHNLRIIHRDIKPQNILVAFPKRTQPNGTRLVISDFGLGKNLPENVSTLVDPTGNAGTSGWKAPELISQPRENEGRHSHNTPINSDSGVLAGGGVSGVKRAADIFSLGCLFFWVLTDGVHPFEDENGWQQLRELNIKRDKKNMDALSRWSDAYEPMQLITSMLEHQPENRPTAQAVLNHPYFWPPEKRLAFLCDVSDHFEREPRGIYDDNYAGDSDVLCALEDRAEEVIGAPYARADFLSKLDRQFVDTLGKQRKYSGNRLLDLLRALRNKKNHYEDMPENVKRFVGPLAGGYLGYWMKKFPRLLMSCYEVVHECGLQGNDRFKGYFGLGKDL
ncbi:unnamed protein product [Zymoseptoria tritici ST99CH_3D1]|uniref:non-specific serine/threonine protein kinase n=1 Tax=Zymoseptoria tritici ST99CH_1E4 TaxID=1276532 RepID=A0A2H1GP84_ZYMTR|nr:unnamed protein product [Zymoseptoria tritici ST99CH_1E4]SMR57742.1 unnamed protein product [Zymoseptoria tritici ST99CH_3D1]